MTALAKKLHLIDYFTLGFGVMVGTGWLVAMDNWLARGGSVGAMLGFVTGTVALFPVAYVYGRLVRAMPDAAGEVAYTARVFPEFVSFATGWTMLLSYFVVCPFEAVAAGKIAAHLFPILDSIELYRVAGQPVYLPRLALGLLVVGVMTAINYRGIRLSANFQNWATAGVFVLAITFVSAGFARGTPANLPPFFNGNAFVSILLVVQIVPFFMEGFEAVGKSAEEASADFGEHHYFRAIALALVIGGLFYLVIIAAVSYAAPRQVLIHEKFATATAFEKALGSHWIASVVLAAAFLSLLKCFNASMVAASRLLFGLGRRKLVSEAVAYVHPVNRTPTTAIAWLGLGTALILLGGESILVPVAEVGSVTAAVGWMAACASYARMKPSLRGRVAAYLGLAVTASLVFMKLAPGIPGHFSVYEWIAVAIWCTIGWSLHAPAFRASRVSPVSGPLR